MERKLNGASAKLKSLKELISSTISLNQNQGGSRANMSNSGSIIVRNGHHHQQQYGAKNSVSLFNLMDPSPRGTGVGECDGDNGYNNDGPSTRPLSMTVTAYGFAGASKSVSMYGLVEASERTSACQQQQPHNSVQKYTTPHSKNPALKLFYTIRSKFQRRRDRGLRTSKIVDSKSTDFGTFLSERNRNSTSNDTSNNARYQLKSSQSAEHIDNSFVAPIGYRNECDDHDRGSSAVMIVPLHNSLPDANPTISTEPPPPTRSSVLPVSLPPKTKCLTKELCDLLQYGWYWGGLSKEEAEEKLKGHTDGAFIVRDSSSDFFLLTLSFNSNGRTLHTRIEYRNGEFRFHSSEADSFPSVVELIEHCIAYSESGVFCYSKARHVDHPSYPVRLTKPISRFTEVKSLLYLSRFAIRKHCRVDLIPSLPLPPTLIDLVQSNLWK